MTGYPWIPREYYPAVMFACKMIRENGTYNKAIETAARYYKVDKDELSSHVRARQAAGQKGRSRPSHGPLKWWVIPVYQNDDHENCWQIASAIRRGYSAESVWRTLSHSDKTSIYSSFFKSYGDAIGPFDTEDEARRKAIEVDEGAIENVKLRGLAKAAWGCIRAGASCSDCRRTSDCPLTAGGCN